MTDDGRKRTSLTVPGIGFRSEGVSVEKGTPNVVEALHKMCGSVEVAKDLVGRTEAIYARNAAPSDIHVLECFERAAFALSLVSEALRGQLRSASLGPAA